jgi:hypothetical protein
VPVATASSNPGTSPLARSVLTIQANSAGVQNLGGFHPIRNPTVGAAVRAYGRPSSRRLRYAGAGCEITWPKIGLRMSFAYYGGGPGTGLACRPGRGIAKSALIIGPGADRWRTSRGAQIGDSREELKDLHPSAVEVWDGSYWLETGYSPVGDGGSYPVLAALIDRGTVSGFEVLMSPGYD